MSTTQNRTGKAIALWLGIVAVSLSVGSAGGVLVARLMIPTIDARIEARDGWVRQKVLATEARVAENEIENRAAHVRYDETAKVAERDRREILDTLHEIQREIRGNHDR